MAIHKYMFFIDNKGIRTYKFKSDATFEIFKYKGESVCKNKDMKSFYEWFEKAAAIARDDYVDFCFLSNEPIEMQKSNYSMKDSSSWKQDEVLNFYKKNIGENTCEIHVDDDHRFVYQPSNVYDTASVKTLYLKCFPDFCFEKKKIMENSSDEISLMSRYFFEMLKNL